MEGWNIDVPVFLIFFNRPDTFKSVFESVKAAKPSKLFLACDGARNEDDTHNIEECKKIAEDIDWDCEVYKNYSDENLGCGMRMYTGLNWAFQYVDQLIILEDDCVPSQDFYRFCYELLERYKDDDRIYMIDAMNQLGIYDKTPYSYFFGGGCCWGWATWKRAWQQMEYNAEFLNDDYSMQCVEKLYPYYFNARKIGYKISEVLKQGKRLSAWTYQCGMATALQNQICIIPKYNMITNIGLTADSVHAVNNIRKLAKKTQGFFNTPTYTMDFPIKHPKYVVEDRMYYEAVRKKFKLTFWTRMESVIRRIIFADKGDIKRMVRKIPYKLRLKK